MNYFIGNAQVEKLTAELEFFQRWIGRGGKAASASRIFLEAEDCSDSPSGPAARALLLAAGIKAVPTEPLAVDLYAAAHRMQAVGGGFASAIADAWFRADSGNRARLEAAFGDLFERYAGEA